jgi:hypothetical protein
VAVHVAVPLRVCPGLQVAENEQPAFVGLLTAIEPVTDHE